MDDNKSTLNNPTKLHLINKRRTRLNAETKMPIFVVDITSSSEITNYKCLSLDLYYKLVDSKPISEKASV